MKNKFSRLFVLACASLALLPTANATVILSDHFNGNAVNTSIWTPSAPLSDSQMSVSGGTANFFQRGILVTNNPLPNAIDITGRFAFTGGSYDQFQINLRSDGVLLSPHYNFQNNIYVGFNRRGGDDGNKTGLNNLTLAAGINTPGVLGNFTFQDNIFYDFRILDTGSSISVFIGDLNNALLSVNTTERTGNLVGIENRGYVPWFPTYDNAVKLDFIQISNVPESGSTIALLAVALFGIAVARMRRISALKGALIALGASVLFTTGCATNGSQPRQQVGAATQEWIGRVLTIGSSASELRGILGAPSNATSRITAEGRAEVWAYKFGDLVAKHEGSGASFGYGMIQGVNRTQDRIIYVTLVDGKVTAITGL